MRWIVIFVISLFLLFPFVSADMGTSFSQIQDYINSYDSGEINAPQLIVYVGYLRNKMYDGKEQEFSESEIKKFFDKVEKSNQYLDHEYEKVFFGKDFNVVFKAKSFVKQTQEYYESRADSEKFYYVDYDLVPVVSSEDSVQRDLNNFIEKIKGTIDDEDLNYSGLQEEFSKIRTTFNREGNCEELVRDLELEMEEKDYPTSEKRYFKVLETDVKENCWIDSVCEPVCEKREECDGQEENCYEKEVCEDKCEEVFDEETNETREQCDSNCKIEEVCEGGENCFEYDDCRDECEDKEYCEDYVDGELMLNVNCGEDWSDISFGGWNKFERYNSINEGSNWNCESEIESLVLMRKAIQKDFNEDFIHWYFDEFVGEDYFKIIYGKGELQDVVWKLIRIDEEISYRLTCSETGEWPEGFDKIDIVYDNDNTHFEVWEKFIPIDGMEADYYTTMFKYYWAPDKEMAKNIISYMVDNEFQPSAKDIAKIKSDEGQMALIQTIADKYGGSLDIHLKLKQRDSDFEISRYLKINPEDVISIGTEEIKTDISIEIDFDVLYNFIISMTKQEESNRIQGPFWVQVYEDQNTNNVFSVIGSISKAWREGVTIKPKYALIKLFFSAKDIVEFMSSGDIPEDNLNKSKISGEVVLTKQ